MQNISSDAYGRVPKNEENIVRIRDSRAAIAMFAHSRVNVNKLRGGEFSRWYSGR